MILWLTVLLLQLLMTILLLLVITVHYRILFIVASKCTMSFTITVRHTFRTLSSWYAPAYLIDELCQVADVEACQRLCSSSSSSLIVSRTRLSTVGDRAFPVSAARVWNSLPHLVTSAPSVAVFRSRLKTHLFNISYPSPL